MFAEGSFPSELLKRRALKSSPSYMLLLLLWKVSPHPPAESKPHKGRNHTHWPVIHPGTWDCETLNKFNRMHESKTILIQRSQAYAEKGLQIKTVKQPCTENVGKSFLINGKLFSPVSCLGRRDAGLRASSAFTV